jgi:hypothetical protein
MGGGFSRRDFLKGSLVGGVMLGAGFGHHHLAQAQAQITAQGIDATASWCEQTSNYVVVHCVTNSDTGVSGIGFVWMALVPFIMTAFCKFFYFLR